MDAAMEGGPPAPRQPQSSGKVEEAQIGMAVDALLKWTGSQKQREKAQLLEDDQLLYLVVSLKKIPDRGRTNPFRIAIPHPLYQLDGSQEICLIVSDREQSKEKMNKKMAQERIAKEGLKIAKVIPLSKLKTDYFAYEAKRKLCGSYDIFLVDDRILAELPTLLGKAFYKKKKHPIPVNLTRAQWSGQINASCSSTFMYVSGGTCSVVKVGRVSQPRVEIIENVKAVIEGVSQQVPKKWENIRALFLKSLESVALPLFQSLPNMPLKIEISSGQQQEVEGKVADMGKDGKKAVGGKGKKVRRSKKMEEVVVEAKDINMDVGEEPVDTGASKKRKHTTTEGKRKASRKGAAVATGA